MRWTRATMFLAVLALVVAGGRAAVHGQAPGVITQTATEAAASSLAAAVRIFDADPDPACAVGQAQVCLQPSSTPEQAALGIARFGVSGSGPEGQGAFLGILGRDPDGGWQFWFGTQNTVYQLLDLPGAMTVCADGDGLNIRAAPSTDAAIVMTLPDLTGVTAVQFTLTQPGALPTATTDQVVGSGWYYLSAPVEGWASSLYLENAALERTAMQPPCAIRNLFVRR